MDVLAAFLRWTFVVVGCNRPNKPLVNTDEISKRLFRTKTAPLRRQFGRPNRRVCHAAPFASPRRLLQEVHRVLKPTTFGENVTHVVKLPMLISLRLSRTLRGRPTRVWEHDMIDVHNCRIDDIREISTDFKSVRILAEGFFEPVVDRGLWVPLQRVFGRFPAVRAGPV